MGLAAAWSARPGAFGLRYRLRHVLIVIGFGKPGVLSFRYGGVGVGQGTFEVRLRRGRYDCGTVVYRLG